MVPPGTTVLIFLEGMFREPQSPRGKDNGGCDVTSILGAKWGKGKILGGLDEFWNAFPQGITESTLLKEDLKWLPYIYIYTPTPAHIGTTYSFVVGHC